MIAGCLVVVFDGEAFGLPCVPAARGQPGVRPRYALGSVLIGWSILSVTYR
jgi:hypothetical protein